MGRLIHLVNLVQLDLESYKRHTFRCEGIYIWFELMGGGGEILPALSVTGTTLWAGLNQKETRRMAAGGVTVFSLDCCDMNTCSCHSCDSLLTTCHPLA
jgi:hypothetical protein